MILNSPYVTGSLTVTGNIISSGSITISGSIASASFATTSSYSVSSSYSLSGSYALSGSYSFNATTSSNSLTASSADNFVVRQNVTASNMLATGRITAQTLVVQTVTSSIVYSSGSNIFGNQLTDVQQMTGSLRVTGSGNNYFLGGNVGIGNSSPVKALEVVGDYRQKALVGNSEGFNISINSATDVVSLTNYYNAALNLGTSNTSRLTILGTGLVGINTTSPSYTLDVSGSARITAPTTELSLISTGTSNVANFSIQGGEGAAATLTFKADDGDNAADVVVLRQADQGPFTINVNNDTLAALSITSTGAATFSSSVTATSFASTLSSGYNIVLNKGGGPAIQFNKTDATARSWEMSGGDAFYIYDGTASAYRFYINSSGNVGIGTTSPNNLLDIATPITNALYGFSMSYSGTAVGVYQVNNATGELKFGGAAAGYFPTFYAGGAERLRITSAGNVGIGTCDPQKPLELRTGGTSTTPSQLFAGGISQVIVGGETQIAFSSNISPTLGSPTATELARAGIGFQYLSSAQPSEFSIGIQCVNTCGANVKIWNVCERIRITCTGDIRVNFNPGGTNGIYFQDVANGATMFYVIPAVYLGTPPYNSNRIIATNSTHIAFETGGAERMRITSGGNALIGTTTDNGQKLQVSGSNGAYAASIVAGTSTGNSYGLIVTGGTDNSDSSLFVRNTGGATTYFRVRGDGLIFAPPTYSNTFASAANMYVNTDGSFGRATSSEKYKKNIIDYTKGISDVLKLRPVSYESKNPYENGLTFAGLIAEEVHNTGLTEFVQYAEDGTPDALAYQNMVALLTKAIQEQHCTICTQALRINILESCLGLT